MPDGTLSAHSLAETQLYLKVTACEACGCGPYNELDRSAQTMDELSVSVVRARCRACGRLQNITFQIVGQENPEDAPLPPINQSNLPSKIIDLAGWLTLYELAIVDARRESDPQRARTLSLRALQILGEALKFYTEGGNDLPPATAFFSKRSRDWFRSQPQQFSRQRVLGERARLPHAGLSLDSRDSK